MFRYWNKLTKFSIPKEYSEQKWDDTLSEKIEEEQLYDRLMGITFSQGIKGINNSHFSDDSLLLGGTPKHEKIHP